MDEGLGQNEYLASVLLVLLRSYIIIYPYWISEISPRLILSTVMLGLRTVPYMVYGRQLQSVDGARSV